MDEEPWFESATAELFQCGLGDGYSGINVAHKETHVGSGTA